MCFCWISRSCFSLRDPNNWHNNIPKEKTSDSEAILHKMNNFILTKSCIFFFEHFRSRKKVKSFFRSFWLFINSLGMFKITNFNNSFVPWHLKISLWKLQKLPEYLKVWYLHEQFLFVLEILNPHKCFLHCNN